MFHCIVLMDQIQFEGYNQTYMLLERPARKFSELGLKFLHLGMDFPLGQAFRKINNITLQSVQIVF